MEDVFALLFIADPGVRKRGRGQIGHASLRGVAHATWGWSAARWMPAYRPKRTAASFIEMAGSDDSLAIAIFKQMLSSGGLLSTELTYGQLVEIKPVAADVV